MKKIKENIILINTIIYLIFYEIIFITLKGGNLQNIILKVLFDVQIAFIISILANIFSKKINNIIYGTVIIIIPVICSIYYVYYKTFGTVISLYSLTKGAGVLQFSSTVLEVIKNNILAILLFCLPPLLYFCVINNKIEFKKMTKKKAIIYTAIFVCVYSVSILTINVSSKEEIYSSKNLYYNINEPNKNLEEFGIFTTIRLDIQRKLTNFKEKQLYEYEDENGNKKVIDKNDYNMLDIDFDELIEQEDNETIVDIHQYLKNQEPSNKNKYTGMFKDKNLIVIVGESFSSLAIKEEITPTLYKIANEGMQFKNFYTPLFPVSTADGEYLTDTSLLPSEGVWSIEKDDGKIFPYSYANALKKQGYKTYAYHNYKYDYYKRDSYFETMGYDTYLADGNGLEERMNFDKVPSSDYDMIEATIDDYINDEKFVAYYMTMSGHMSYDKSNNIVNKNWDLVKELPYSEKAKGYLATQIELDKAIEKILQKLEEKNKLDDTVIVITGDHYPYGLSECEIKELSPYNMNDYYFEKFHMPFIVYNGNNTSNIVSEKYASSLDVLPTILNLFGVEYDSRLLMGRDILSDSEPIVIFSDRSFITNKGKYNSYSRIFTKYDNNDKFSAEEYTQKIKEEIYLKYRYSRLILENDYYRKIQKWICK